MREGRFDGEHIRWDDLTAIGSSGCGGPRVGFLEDDVILAQNAMTVLGDLPVKPPDDVLGVSLWDADDKPLWHRCFNCYSKAIVYDGATL